MCNKLTPIYGLTSVLLGIVCLLPILCAEAQIALPTASNDADKRASSSENVRMQASITLTGERVCLQRRAEKDGRVLMDCVIGLRGDDERFYGLRSVDPSRIEPFPTMNTRVLVTGTFLPSSGDTFEIVGDILYESIDSTDDPKRVTGKLLCVNHDAPRLPRAEACKMIVQTPGGLFWGLQAHPSGTAAQWEMLRPGMIIEAEGEIFSAAPLDWHSWASLGAPRRIQGVLAVKNIKRIATH